MEELNDGVTCPLRVQSLMEAIEASQYLSNADLFSYLVAS